MSRIKNIHVITNKKLLSGLIIALSCLLFSDYTLFAQDSAKKIKENSNFEYRLFRFDTSDLSKKLFLHDESFVFPEAEIIPFSNTKFLCHLTLMNKAGENAVLVFKCPNTVKFEIFRIIEGDRSVRKKLVTNPYVYKNNHFISEFPEGFNQLVIKIKTSQFIGFRVESKNKQELFKIERRYNLYYGIGIGSILLLLLYHSILFFIVRERLYLYFVVQTGLTFSYIYLSSGFLLPPLPHFASHLVFSLLQMSFLLVFVSDIKLKFINTEIYTKFANLIPLFIIIPVVYFVLPGILTKALHHTFNLIFIIIYIVLAIKYLPERGISRRLSFSAWIILLIGSGTIPLQSISLFGNSILINHSFEISLFLFNILFALALANKLNIYKTEKKIAEALEINALREKENLIQETNEILESLIFDRNKELLEKINKSSEQKLEIEKQNETINESIRQIDKINNELIIKNNEIQNQNIELEEHHKILEKTVNKRTKKLMKAREMAITAEKLKTSFLNNLTQEINTPMNAITGYASLITDKTLNQEKRNEYLNNIVNYVDILLDSVDNIVTLSRIQAGIIKYKPDLISLKQLYNKFKTQTEDKISFSRKNIELITTLQNQTMEMYAEVDHNKLWQIISILMDISIRQIQEGQILLTIKPDPFDEAELREKSKLSITMEINSFDNSLQIIEQTFNMENTNTEIKTKYTSQIELGIAIIKSLSSIIKGKSLIKQIPGGISFRIKLNTDLSGPP